MKLKQNIEEYNPRISFNSPNFSNEAQALIDSYNDSLTWPSFYSLVYQMCAKSNEAGYFITHQSNPFQKDLERGHIPLFPINVKILDGKIFVWDDRSAEAPFERTDLITSINGHTSEEILNILYSCTPKDILSPQVIEPSLWNDFNWKYFLFVDTASAFNVTATSTTGQVKTHEIKGKEIPIDMPTVWYHEEPSIASEATEDFLSQYFLTYDENIAELHLPEFWLLMKLRGELVNYTTYKYIFKEIAKKHVDHLIIDLRAADSQLLSEADDMVPFIFKQNDNDSFLRMDFNHRGSQGKTSIPKPSKLAFQGQLYVLVDATTSAVGCTLARYLVEYGNAISIGQETSVRYEGWTDINSKQIDLLFFSRLRVYIPRIYYQFPDSEKQTTINRGLLPQFPVSYTLEDLLEGKDLEMDKAMYLIKNTNQ